MSLEDNYAREVRLKKLEELAHVRLRWDEAPADSQAWWSAYIESNHTDLESALLCAYALAARSITLARSPAQLTEALAVVAQEPSVRMQHFESVAQALAAYDSALVTAPWDFLVLTARGFYLNQQGRFLEALTACEQALRLDPGSDQAFNNRGFALLGLGRYDEALVSCSEAAWLNPGNASAFTNQGNALCMLGRFDEAVAAFDQALLRDPALVAVHSNRAEALNSLGRYDEAFAAASRARELAPELASPNASQGFALFAKQEFAAAAQAFALADRLAQLQNPIYLLFQAVALLATGAPGSRQEGVRLLANTRFQGFQGHRLLILRTYQYLHALSRQGQLVRLAELKRLLESGVRFPRTWQYSLTPNLTQATLCHHEDAAWLPSLLEVVLGRQPLTLLESWPLWSQLSLPER